MTKSKTKSAPTPKRVIKTAKRTGKLSPSTVKRIIKAVVPPKKRK